MPFDVARLPPRLGGMRAHFLFFILLLGLIATPALAAADATRSAIFTQEKTKTLDGLFNDLKRSRDSATAERLTTQIWRQWSDSGSDSINVLMEWAQRAIGSRNFPAALDTLDQIVLLAPDFSEGWNRRATLHFMMENPSKSMADIERTLVLEPRHFGALAGMAEILRARGDNALALKAYERALEVHPMMRGAQLANFQICWLATNCKTAGSPSCSASFPLA
jgi:tetratricopeptide (TPR) repeat protein